MCSAQRGQWGPSTSRSPPVGLGLAPGPCHQPDKLALQVGAQLGDKPSSGQHPTLPPHLRQTHRLRPAPSPSPLTLPQPAHPYAAAWACANPSGAHTGTRVQTPFTWPRAIAFYEGAGRAHWPGDPLSHLPSELHFLHPGCCVSQDPGPALQNPDVNPNCYGPLASSPLVLPRGHNQVAQGQKETSTEQSA